MTRPSDLHWGLVDERAFRVVRQALDVVGQHRRDHVLGGGWAVYAHAPVVPSVDCDLYLPGPPDPPLEEALRARGLTVGPLADVEFLAMDEPAEFLGFGDQDLGVPGFAFTPRALFEERVVARMLHLEPPLLGVRVPEAPALAVAKAAALRGRSLGYAAHADGRARMLLGPERVPMMLSLPPSYYLRKAGKDLFDLSLLLAGEAERGAFRGLVRTSGLEPAVRDTLREVPVPVVEFADDLGERAGRASPSAWLRAWHR